MKYAALLALLATWACQDIAVPSPDPPPDEPRVQDAIEKATAAVVSDPDSADAWGRLGMVLDAHHYFREAIECYRRALQLDATDFRWSYHLAITLDREGGNLEEVIDRFEQAAELEPRYPPPRYLLGTVFQRHGRYAEARRAFERALELDPELSIARRQLGRTLLALGEPERAVTELERAATVNPEDGAIHSALAEAYARLGRRERARAAADRSRGLAPDAGLPDPIRYDVVSMAVSSSLANERGQRALEEGRFDDAIALFEIRNEVNPSASNYYFLGLSHKRNGSHDDAIRFFEEAVAMGDHAPSHWQLGELMIAEGRKPQGLEQLRRGRAAATNATDLQTIGASFARHGALEDAVEAFATAGRLDASSSSLEADWCAALLQLGRVDEGLPHCEKAVVLDDVSARAHLNLGIALEMSDRASDARRHYERAVALDPDSRARERLR